MKIAELEKPEGDPLDGDEEAAPARSMIPSNINPASPKFIRPSNMRLRERRGVCQDFAHIMIAIARAWGVPTRYVSGYMYHRGNKDRSGADATHAWVEAYLPSLGWVGFDPTNNILAGERHVRAAVGRDYADVPPTRGTYKGVAESELSIAVASSRPRRRCGMRIS